jgi:hypothetical protein
MHHVAPRMIGERMTTRRTGAWWLALLAAFSLLLAG